MNETKLYKKEKVTGLVRTPTDTYYVLDRVINGRFTGVSNCPIEVTEHGYWYSRPQVIDVHGTYTYVRWKNSTMIIMCWTGETDVPQEEAE